MPLVLNECATARLLSLNPPGLHTFQDALQLLSNLLRNNLANQRFFRWEEGREGYRRWLAKLGGSCPLSSILYSLT